MKVDFLMKLSSVSAVLEWINFLNNICMDIFLTIVILADFVTKALLRSLPWKTFVKIFGIVTELQKYFISWKVYIYAYYIIFVIISKTKKISIFCYGSNNVGAVLVPLHLFQSKHRKLRIWIGKKQTNKQILTLTVQYVFRKSPITCLVQTNLIPEPKISSIE